MALDLGLLLVTVAGVVVYSGLRTKQQRDKIKERTNKEFLGGTQLSSEQLEKRLAESEQMYEGLEETYWVHVAVLAAVCSYLYWHIWYVSIAVGVSIALAGIRYLSLKPFSSGFPDTDSRSGSE